MRKFLPAVALAAAATFALGACSSNSTSDGGPSGSASASGSTAGSSAPAGELTTITIGASPVPHAQILKFVQDNLAAAAGLNLKIVEYQDYIQPNEALAAGDLDANYFQHLPYYEQQVADRGYKFAHFDGVHIEPMGIYSKKLTDLTHVPDGAKVSVTDDPSNQARGLALLAQAGLITLPSDKQDITVLDITGQYNPKHLTFVPMVAEQLPRTLEDVDLSVINGNFALAAGLTPSKDALLLESGKDNPYANIVAVRAGDEKRPELIKLDELLHSQQVADFITKTWPDGAVVPAF